MIANEQIKTNRYLNEKSRSKARKKSLIKFVLLFYYIIFIINFHALKFCSPNLIEEKNQSTSSFQSD